ncbi:MAG: hypothetical protein O2971_13205 [Proteobacteria bacterium]|nr:hypothetical protein [Pseudomonadota bacterium]
MLKKQVEPFLKIVSSPDNRTEMALKEESGEWAANYFYAPWFDSLVREPGMKRVLLGCPKFSEKSNPLVSCLKQIIEGQSLLDDLTDGPHKNRLSKWEADFPASIAAVFSATLYNNCYVSFVAGFGDVRNIPFDGAKLTDVYWVITGNKLYFKWPWRELGLLSIFVLPLVFIWRIITWAVFSGLPLEKRRYLIFHNEKDFIKYLGSIYRNQIRQNLSHFHPEWEPTS